MPPRRTCPTCSHRDPLLTGRCTAITEQLALCGCSCDPPAPTPRGPHKNAGSRYPRQTLAVCEAILTGHAGVKQIAGAAGIPARTAHNTLVQLVNMGLLNRDLETGGRRPERHLYSLTIRARVLFGLHETRNEEADRPTRHIQRAGQQT
ncbi:hypothetical protein ACWKSP_22065 [Micromonosporaceae bacterium Da 78-11]